MDNSYLKEYRCECGKLLFKGSLISAVVEVKCKRCGKVNLFEENHAQKIPAPFTLEIDGAKLVKKPDSQTYN